MNKLMISILLFFVITTCISQNKELENSILAVKPAIQFNSFKFNKALDKELKSSIIVMYKISDLNTVSLSVNTAYFSKPISKFAFENENYKKMQFYKYTLPKQIDFINFQRNINNSSLK